MQDHPLKDIINDTWPVINRSRNLALVWVIGFIILGIVILLRGTTGSTVGLMLVAFSFGLAVFAAKAGSIYVNDQATPIADGMLRTVGFKNGHAGTSIDQLRDVGLLPKTRRASMEDGITAQLGAYHVERIEWHLTETSGAGEFQSTNHIFRG